MGRGSLLALPQGRREFGRRIDHGAVELGLGDLRLPEIGPAEVGAVHLETTSREFAEIKLIGAVAAQRDVAVGIIDVKSYYIETPQDVAARVRRCLEYAPTERLSFAPDCGLSQTARCAARAKLLNVVAGIRQMHGESGP